MFWKLRRAPLVLVCTLTLAVLPNVSLAQSELAAANGNSPETLTISPLTALSTSVPVEATQTSGPFSETTAIPEPSATPQNEPLFPIDLPADYPSHAPQGVVGANYWDIIRPNSFSDAHWWCLANWDLCRITTLEQPTKELTSYYQSLLDDLDEARATEESLEKEIESLAAAEPRVGTDSLTDLCNLVQDAASCFYYLPARLQELWGYQRKLQEIREQIANLERELNSLIEVLDELPEKDMGDCLNRFRICEYEAYSDEQSIPETPPKAVG